MVKLRKYSLILGVLLLIGCSSTPLIIEKPIYISVPYQVVDTVKLIGDTIWYGGIINDKDTIGSVAVNPKSKTAVVNIQDTIKKIDTIKVEVPIEKEKVVQIISGFLPWWGEAILIIIGILLLVFINKKSSLINLIKGKN